MGDNMAAMRLLLLALAASLAHAREVMVGDRFWNDPCIPDEARHDSAEHFSRLNALLYSYGPDFHSRVFALHFHDRARPTAPCCSSAT